nr:MAG TPA: AAA lid domain protein [Caudoviricetes sp.]
MSGFTNFSGRFARTFFCHIVTCLSVRILKLLIKDYY